MIEILTTTVQAQPIHDYEYSLSSSPHVQYLDPSITVHVNTPQDKKNALLASWTEGSLAGGCTGMGILAGAVTPASAVAYVGEVIGFLATDAAMQHAVDPDINYMQIAVKEPISIPELSEIPEIPSKEFARDSINLLEDTNAYTKTMTRYDGAVLANDKEWILIHQNMAALYTKNAAADCVKLKQSGGIFINELKASNLSVTDTDVTNVKLQLIHDGLPDYEIRILKRMGYTNDQIKEMGNITASTISPEYLIHYDISILQSIDTLNGIYTNESFYFASEIANSSISTTIKFDPDVLDRNGNSTYLSAYIEIPNQDVSQINISTIKMNGIPAINDTSFSFVTNPEILDRDSNGNTEIKIVFDKKSIQSVLTKGENDVTVTGQINEIFFVGTGVIAVYTTSTPTTDFSANSTAGNAPLTAAFTSTSSGYPDMWMWDFGDGEQSYEKNPVHAYTTKGTYNVSLKVINDNGIYSEEKTDYISVLTSTTPTANFTAEAKSVTKPIIMNFTDRSSNNPIQWFWDFGDESNSTVQNPTHAYTTAGNYTVILHVVNHVGEDTTFRLVTIPEITNIPFANFTASKVTGKSPLIVMFNDTSLNATSRLWDFGDDTKSNENNPIQTYSSAGNYTVKLIAINSDGSDTLTAKDFITVIRPDPPVANFTANSRSGQAPLTVMFNDTSNGDTITLWYWTFGDGTNASVPNPIHTYTAAGNYTVSFEIANTVGDNVTTKIDYITVRNPPLTTIPTTVPTTTITTPPTTKPTPTTTHAPLSPLVVIGAISLIGLFVMNRKKRDH